MIDYDKPDPDPIVAEVRRAREQLAAEFGYDLRALFAEMQKRQATSGRVYANRPIQRVPTGSQNPTRKVG